MASSLVTLRDSLVTRLSAMDNVAIHEKPIEPDAVRRHLWVNHVRVRVELTREELRLGIAGFLGGADPMLLGPDDQPEEERLLAEIGPVIFIPPVWKKDGQGNLEEFRSFVTRTPGAILAISTFDGGLGTITIKKDLSVKHTIEPQLEWNVRILDIMWAIAAEIDRLHGGNGESLVCPVPEPK